MADQKLTALNQLTTPLATDIVYLVDDPGGTPVSKKVVVSDLLALGAVSGLVLLESHTASASTSLDFTTRNATGQSGATFQSDFDEYAIECVSIVQASNSTPQINFSTDGGSTYDASSIYEWVGLYAYGGGSGKINNASDTKFPLRDTTTTLQTGGSFNAWFKLFNPTSASLHKILTGTSLINDNAAGLIEEYLALRYASATAVNAFRFKIASGNITSGTIRVYGVAKSIPSASGTGTIVQVVNTETGAVATGATAIPVDDTIPQNTEGVQFMSLAVTPKSATNKLKIDVVFQASLASANKWVIAALFQDSTANALALGFQFSETATAMMTVTFTHYMTAGTTSATTFKVRGGCQDTTTMTFNGQSSARLYGGVCASSITITEIAA